LKNFNETQWPLIYPQTQSALPTSLSRRSTQSDCRVDADTTSERPTLQRSNTSQNQPTQIPQESQLPRLVADSLESNARVLKVDLRVGASGHADLSNLERKSIATLIGSQIVKSLKHLDSLKDRLEDTSSKVLVTGDLNAGKSTFCNALLRRKVLPEDQQPCTSLFCEVLDVTLNDNIEQVHAVIPAVKYDRTDKSTYDIYTLEDLEDIVVEKADVYSSVKVYVRENREDKLLRNGIVDIALIDAPGLNHDSLQTTAVFARQEEIDVVVFVVSAENHFTLSAKEFLWNAANEKAYLFIVVNRFDNIRDKDRCRAQVLRQIAKLSPATYADAADLVHFVSSNEIVEDTNPHVDFERLEESLRCFVLEKRARSKLAPVKTYLSNVLEDITSLASSNKIFAEDEIKQAKDKLAQIQPEYESRLKTKITVMDQIEREIEENSADILQSTRKSLNNFIFSLDIIEIIPYPGILHAWQYAEDTKRVMCEKLDAQVVQCESNAKTHAIKGIDLIRSIGIRNFPTTPFNKTFHPENMFRGKRHGIERALNIQVSLSDFFDFESSDLGTLVLSSATACTVLGSRFLPIKNWIDGALNLSQFVGSSRKWILIPLALGVSGGLIWFVVSDIPKAVPRQIARKVQRELDRVDYVNCNADRIARELRTVLGVPEKYLREQFHRDIEERVKAKEGCVGVMRKASVAKEFFGKMEVEGLELRGVVNGYVLEPVVGSDA
jgi:mitofusin 2